MDIKEVINQNEEYLNLFAFIIGLAGFILAFVFYFKAKNIKKVNYFIHSFNLINEDISSLEGLEVIYKGKKFKNLTISKIAIWNSGNITIDKSDIVELDKLKISSVENVEIFDVEILSQVESTNNFIIDKNENFIEIVFDYIDPNQGCSIKIYHTGEGSSDILIDGKIKGAGQIKVLDDISFIMNLAVHKSTNNSLLSISMMFIIFKIGWILYLVMTIVSLFYVFYKENYWLLFATAFCILGIFVLFPRNKLPEILKTIYSDEK
ncbi:hypothetical protein MH928_07495 [Flavobacterium sp. WW92]|uniref:hypothetical protein n=1 Tax=unclassified Flavobacterium TaxID=196869 RepID=UPI00222575EF|nr:MULTISPECIES: hypothetical protein [unclassified Flavobacterium]WDO14531.1 hypothetical protein MH928_07495 [Flavobacterium sp. WW92]